MLEKGSVISADARKYTILELLGQGANTAAYLAECRHGGLTAKCILKEYAPQNPARRVFSPPEQCRIRSGSSPR